MDISVGVFALVSAAKKGAYVLLDKRSNEEVSTRTRYYDADSELAGNPTLLLPADEKKGFEFGGKRVCYDFANKFGSYSWHCRSFLRKRR